MKSTACLTASLVALTMLASDPRLAAQTTPTVTTLHSFTAGTDGANPMSSLVQGTDGNFYGTLPGTSVNNDFGQVFKITPAGAFTTLHHFTGTGTTGKYPLAALVQGKDGNFYGTTEQGGGDRSGTVFKITTAGALTNLHDFTDSNGDGGYPQKALIQANDGNFYGTTFLGGGSGAEGGDGTIFQLTPAGAVTTLYGFVNDFGGDPQPNTLVQGSDGNFYGTTYNNASGEGLYGSIYQLTTKGVLTVLHNFSQGTDGERPLDALVQGSDGDFYGTTAGVESIVSYGTVFKITSAGVFTALHHFTGYGTDGADSGGSLVKGKDGNYYGTTSLGGSNDFGTIFRVTPAGVFNTIYSFTGSGTNGAEPAPGVIQGSDGNLYGVTGYGGSSDNGTIFKVSLTPVITSPSTATATAGKAFSYQITATNSPTRYGAGGLFKGITVNAQTGLISGTPTASGTHTLTLQAANAFGTGTKTLTLTVAAAPAVMSANTATATVGKAFSYQITATNRPMSFGVGGLFKGISVNPQTGLISGTPMAAATHSLDLRAANSAGTGHKTLTLTVTD